jgi:hypothetical protein
MTMNQAIKRIMVKRSDALVAVYDLDQKTLTDKDKTELRALVTELQNIVGSGNGRLVVGKTNYGIRSRRYG